MSQGGLVNINRLSEKANGNKVVSCPDFENYRTQEGSLRRVSLLGTEIRTMSCQVLIAQAIAIKMDVSGGSR